MTYVLARNTVRDSDQWKRIFDSGIKMRKAGGEVSSRLFHVKGDANALVLLFEFEGEESAKRFLESPELKAKMEEAGVLGEPDFVFLEPM
jgi:uncharacterized protein (DUF1330 family)